MARRNGGVLGPVNMPTTAAANGIWRLEDALDARSSASWPGEPPSSFDYLVIGGGGGGGGGGYGGGTSGVNGYSGAGGGGGMQLEGSMAVTVGNMVNVVIGAGGAGGAAQANGSVGSPSSVGAVTAEGGNFGTATSVGGAAKTGGGKGGDVHGGNSSIGGYDGTPGITSQINPNPKPLAGGGGGAPPDNGWHAGLGVAGGGNGGGGNNGYGNTGGGGGGGQSWNGSYPGGAGGSGMIIVRTPAMKAIGVVAGNPVVTTSGVYRYYTFTASGSIKF